jgi:1-deoxyxylulose-5-phosphate synthase
MQHAAGTHGWTRFVSMQDQYSLVHGEQEREMFGLLADQGVGSIPWSPLAARPARRPWAPAARTMPSPTPRPTRPAAYLGRDKATVDTVEQIASERGLPMATVALA